MITCTQCHEKSPVGAVLCGKCRAPFPELNPSVALQETSPTDPPSSDTTEHWKEGMPIERVTAKFVIVGLNGAVIPETADLAVPIPMQLLRELLPVRIGRRAKPKHGEPPEMDFGPFLQTRRTPPYPLSREAAILYVEQGIVLLRRTGHAPIYKQDGNGDHCLIAPGDVVPLHDGDVLSFGHKDDHVRVIVRLSA